MLWGFTPPPDPDEAESAVKRIIANESDLCAEKLAFTEVEMWGDSGVDCGGFVWADSGGDLWHCGGSILRILFGDFGVLWLVAQEKDLVILVRGRGWGWKRQKVFVGWSLELRAVSFVRCIFPTPFGSVRLWGTVGVPLPPLKSVLVIFYFGALLLIHKKPWFVTLL